MPERRMRLMSALALEIAALKKMGTNGDPTFETLVRNVGVCFDEALDQLSQSESLMAGDHPSWTRWRSPLSPSNP
ncbi:hypothetical protein [Novosphingobium sp.]|uniref:hypothetical protein n=1 Tax=Novosphingobium sp. TaxID=1874826 RepID=UPI00263A25FC|nr:hypothetical protein [Novosphingobium sp.]